MNGFHDRIDEHTCTRIFRSVMECGLARSATAFLVHDLERMRNRLAMLDQAFPPTTLHALAIKANPLVEVLRHAVATGAGLEAASIEEVHLALAANCPAERIVFDSPAKTREEIAESLRLGLILNANSLEELSRIESEWSRDHSRPRIGLRINPEVGQGAIAHTSVAGQASKFGVPISTHRASIVDSFRQYPWLTGLHVHAGSQGCAIEQLCQAVERVNQLRTDIESQAHRSLDFFDLGGGLPAVYQDNQPRIEPAKYAQQLSAVSPDLMSGGPQLITEFGRVVQAGCGITFTRVEYVREESSTAIVHVGADLLMRPVYAAADWKHEFYVLSPDGSIKRNESNRPWDLAGPLCFSGDFIARDMSLPTLEVGDWIAIRDTGAYTLSMWSRHCSRSIPMVLGYAPNSAEELILLRCAETPAKVTDFWSQNPGSTASVSPDAVTASDLPSFPQFTERSTL